MTNSRADIIATIGPASFSPQVLRSLMEKRMDIARFNFSWGSSLENEEHIQTLRAIATEAGRNIPILQDLSGPRLQAGARHGFNASQAEALTAKDMADLDLGAQMKLDMVAQSFVGSAVDIALLRAEMIKRSFTAPIIAKIERKIAVEHIDEIIAASDAIMVARGDLGNSIPLEEIPFVQKTIIEKCNAAQKPVIVATQMLLSMTKETEPTRAEVTDVYQAIVDGADGVMLSEETASGMHPIEALEEMERIVVVAESHATERKYFPVSALV